ncbi:MAG: chlorophyll synthase ChlG [Anaerolineae bacterium]
MEPFASTEKSLEKPALLARSIALMKPVTWFAPMWALLCGAIASGATSWSLPDIFRMFLGAVMAGPVLCGVSQVINDYFDREVDALNEPDRLIPAGLVSLRQVIVTIVILAIIGVAIALYLGRGVTLLVGIGLLFALLYSTPPVRAKRNGWVGNTLVAISYEGLAWLAGHIAFAALTPASILMAALYSFGTHGIMSINDFKSIKGDKASGINTIPVIYGEKGAARLIVMTMDVAQVGVITALLAWGLWPFAAIIAAILLIQLPIQIKFLKDPEEMFLRFSAIGVNFFVWGMMVTAIGIRTLS